MVTGIEQNASVLPLPRCVCDLVTQWQNCAFICASSGTSEFGTMGMHRQMQACTDEFLVTETPSLRRYVVSVEAVLPMSKTSNRRT